VIKMWHTQPYLNIVQQFWATDAPTAANVKYLLSLAFDFLGAPGAIVIESDIFPSKDFYRYFQWAAYHTSTSSFLRRHTFTVNGYHHESQPQGSPYSMSVDHYGFTVWGWFCPAASWPLISSRWTWYHNWDINMEHNIRRSQDNDCFLSLTPQISRVRNIGMKGINFKGGNAEEEARWLAVHVPPQAYKYKDKKVRCVELSVLVDAFAIDAFALQGKWLPMRIEPHLLGAKPVGTLTQKQIIQESQRLFTS